MTQLIPCVIVIDPQQKLHKKKKKNQIRLLRAAMMQALVISWIHLLIIIYTVHKSYYWNL